MIRKQVLIDEARNEAVTELARESGMSFSELIRELIDREVVRRRTDRLRAAAESLRDAYVKDPSLSEFSVTEVEGLDDQG